MNQIPQQFQIAGTLQSCERYGSGHINETYLAVTDKKRYILQKVNTVAFKKPDELMENIVAVTKYLRTKTDDPRGALQLVPTVDGRDYLVTADGGYWRMYDFIEDSLCLDAAETADDFYESAMAFGMFQKLLAAFPAASLHETIVNFHNTPDRCRQFREALEKDSMSRAAWCAKEIKFVLDREQEANTLMDLLKKGELPLRVTHNDTKLNNVMLDATTRKALCVIDLDTVMPGLSLFDYGDSIRFGASTAKEDELDLSKVQIDLSLFEAYTRGFLTACGSSLTAREIELFPLGAKMMTFECGTRFLTDYLSGDVYFHIARPSHNLDRCRTQFKLVAEMEAHWDEMQAIVARVKAEVVG